MSLFKKKQTPLEKLLEALKELQEEDGEEVVFTKIYYASALDYSIKQINIDNQVIKVYRKTTNKKYKAFDLKK